MNCKPSNSCCSPTQQWKEILLNTQDKAIQAYNLAQQALDEIENLPAGGGSVQSVNDELPDQNGNVTVDTGVMTVNGVSPDADGEVTITAGSNITITPDTGTNSIEIEASVPTVEAVAPIYIDQDGKINLAEWELVTSQNWTTFKDANLKATEDLLLFLSQTWVADDIYIPKNCNLSSIYLNSIKYDTSNGKLYVTEPTMISQILNNSPTVTLRVYTLNISYTGSGINEKMSYALYQSSSYPINKILDPASIQSGVKLYRRKENGS